MDVQWNFCCCTKGGWMDDGKAENGGSKYGGTVGNSGCVWAI
jgi:hypothetical protein